MTDFTKENAPAGDLKEIDNPHLPLSDEDRALLARKRYSDTTTPAKRFPQTDPTRHDSMGSTPTSTEDKNTYNPYKKRPGRESM